MSARPLRIRDFVRDHDSRLYAVAAYDNRDRAGCILRYVPDPSGDRVAPDGTRYRKVDFNEAYDIIRREKPEYLGVLHRVPHKDIAVVLKPDEQFPAVCRNNARVALLDEVLGLPTGSLGCTGSHLCGLGNESSDIDLVVYGEVFHQARIRLDAAIQEGLVDDLTPALWHFVYEKRKPEITFDQFMVHEQRKQNRGEIEGTYFDLLFSRSYDQLRSDMPPDKGRVVGLMTVTAPVTDARLAFDSPAVYHVEHDEIDTVYSFTHTYCGQALKNELIEARGVVEEASGRRWLVVGTSREARGEYIVSRTLLEQGGDEKA
jgi:uncharacterized protein